MRFVDADLRTADGLAEPEAPAGPQRPAGPRGPVGPAGRAPLALALSDTRLSARARRAVTLRYAATERARILVRIVRGRRTLARARGRARGGANRIRLRTPDRACRYRLRLEARTADRRGASARALLIVRTAGRGRG